jgi:endoglucanase
MGVGINLGNTLDAPVEGAWAPAAQEWQFDAYAAKGFTTIRVPVCWNKHTSTQAPYAIDGAWMARVQTVVGWALSRNMITVLNSHHDTWLDTPTNFTANLPRQVFPDR